MMSKIAKIKLNNGVIQFRHPLALDGNGYGKVIRRGVGKLPEGRQGKIVEGLKILLSFCPKLRKEVEGREEEITSEALAMYFEPLSEAQAGEDFRKKYEEAQTERTEVAETYSKYMPDIPGADLFDLSEPTAELVNKLMTTIRKKDGEVNRLTKDIQDKDNIIEGLGAATGVLTEEKKSKTIGKCLDHFKTHTVCKSEEARHDLLRRVNKIVEQLKPETPHALITKGMIEKAVSDCKPSQSERLNLLREAKRFFKELAYPTSSDGLGLGNPAISIKAGSQASLQRKRRQEGIEILDPRPLLELKHLSSYWKALIAVIGFGGLRLAEAASLEWERTAQESGIIKIRATDAYPNLKSVMSERDVKPFKDVWPWLSGFKSKKATGVCFKREDGKTWFRDYKGKPRAIDLSGSLIDVISAALIREPLTKLFEQGTGKGLKELYFEFTNEKGVKDFEPLARIIKQQASKPDLKKLMLCWSQHTGKEASPSIEKKISAILAEAKQTKEPARRLRRFWETAMREACLGHLIEAMGGHSDEVGKAHYTKFEKIVESAKIGKV